MLPSLRGGVLDLYRFVLAASTAAKSSRVHVHAVARDSRVAHTASGCVFFQLLSDPEPWALGCVSSMCSLRAELLPVSYSPGGCESLPAADRSISDEGWEML